MTGKVLEILTKLEPDRMGTEIANFWHTNNLLRRPWLDEKNEIRQYIFATDTTKTTNSKLPWKNKTTIPKMCQIRDNLKSNYTLALFPKKKSFTWEADTKDDNTEEKAKAIRSYACQITDYPQFRSEMDKCIDDFIDEGNAFAMPVWVDNRIESKESRETKVGYVGPSIIRISPRDIVFIPNAPSWEVTPKCIRSLVSIGEVKELLESLSTDDKREDYQKLWMYLRELRQRTNQFAGEFQDKDMFFQVDGFSSYQAYLGSNYCELLTFYGDIYDFESDKFLKNKIVTVADRHKVISVKDNPSFFSCPPIVHVGWRTRQDNLWAMGPLDNLVGMQYRIDHIENLKADCFDLITFPPLKIKGRVDDFEWGPMARIHIGDDGDVEMMAPPFNILTANVEINQYLTMMEEMAGSPKEAMGFRTPGEKTKYEVQRMENAASRIFQGKIVTFEMYFVEPLMNLMLELGRRKTTGDLLVRYFDDEFKINRFLELTPEDISGYGRIKPYAARHFAEKAEMIQNLTNLAASPLGQLIQPHISSINLAAFVEDNFDLRDYKLFTPFVALAEQADAQRIAQAQEEQVLMEALTPSGLTPDDISGGQPGAPGQSLLPPGAYGTVPGSNYRTGPLGGGGY